MSRIVDDLKNFRNRLTIQTTRVDEELCKIVSELTSNCVKTQETHPCNKKQHRMKPMKHLFGMGYVISSNIVLNVIY